METFEISQRKKNKFIKYLRSQRDPIIFFSQEERLILENLVANAHTVISDPVIATVITDSCLFEQPSSLGKYEYISLVKDTLHCTALIFLERESGARTSFCIEKSYYNFSTIKSEQITWIFDSRYEDQLYGLSLQVKNKQNLPDILKNHLIMD